MSQKLLDSILDYLEDTREVRYSKDKANRKNMLRQFDGYRAEWVKYSQSETENFYGYA